MIWVFGYGSLMWRPGFAHRRRELATLPGWSRAFCRLSFRHRGTAAVPGMVAGLEPGGECRGYAYLLEPGQEAQVLEYLDEREGAGYRRIRHPLRIEGAKGTFEEQAWVYVPDESHPTYAPGLPRERIVELIATGQGESGSARDYLAALLAELERMGEGAAWSSLLTAVDAHRREHGNPPRPVTGGGAAEPARA